MMMFLRTDEHVLLSICLDRRLTHNMPHQFTCSSASETLHSIRSHLLFNDQIFCRCLAAGYLAYQDTLPKLSVQWYRLSLPEGAVLGEVVSS